MEYHNLSVKILEKIPDKGVGNIRGSNSIANRNIPTETCSTHSLHKTPKEEVICHSTLKTEKKCDKSHVSISLY